MFTILILAMVAVMAFSIFLSGKAKLLLNVALVLLLPTLAFAQTSDTVTPDQILATVAQIVAYIGGIPTVGAYVLLALKWIGTIASVLSALSVAIAGILLSISGLLKLPEIVSIKAFDQAPQWAEKLSVLSEKIVKLNAKIQPWVQRLSIFNVQKKK